VQIDDCSRVFWFAWRYGLGEFGAFQLLQGVLSCTGIAFLCVVSVMSR
jgi:hypothetical protein